MAQVQGSGSNQVKQLYSYDANGDVISVNYSGTEYYYGAVDKSKTGPREHRLSPNKLDF